MGLPSFDLLHLRVQFKDFFHCVIKLLNMHRKLSFELPIKIGKSGHYYSFCFKWKTTCYDYRLLSDTPACLLHNTQRKRNINRHIRPASSNINYDDRSFETSFKIWLWLFNVSFVVISGRLMLSILNCN